MYFFPLTLFWMSGLGLLAVFGLYPLFLWIWFFGFGPGVEKNQVSKSKAFRVSIIVVFHNAGDLLGKKLANLESIDYPRDQLEFIFFSDGSTDRSIRILRQNKNLRIKLMAAGEQKGKAEGLNKAAAGASGEILVFSDADALFDSESLRKLVRHFNDPEIGGVCGQRRIGPEKGSLQKAQSRYIQLDSLIKKMESRRGSVTSNDGKLYALRRDLFRRIDPAATDDLYSCLSVVKQGYRFVFEPGAVAMIGKPSRTLSHEVQRRRRIVGRSLAGIQKHRSILNPFNYGAYAVGLLINKVLRRCLPLFLIALFLSSLALSWYSSFFLIFFTLQCLFYAACLFYPLSLKWEPAPALLCRVRQSISLITYFVLGNYGSFLGVIDFVSGRQVVKWNPVKTD
ncbi:MAG: glycosyltransferase [Desulfohalobiaceae bacterium]|nr:glycosyltransferase [Desulfohalobiaceae bacterium]